MPSKYIHLVDTDVKNILLELNGELPKEEKDISLKPIFCPRCGKKNPSTSRYCNCGSVLSVDSALAIDELRETPNRLIGKLMEDPEIKRLLVDKILDLGLAK